MTEPTGQRGTDAQALIAEARPVGAFGAAALGLIKAYQYGIRPLLGPRCRFFPSCSEYAADAIRQYGVLRGSALGAVRLGKCHPWHPGGFDPVPDRSPHSGDGPTASLSSSTSN